MLETALTLKKLINKSTEALFMYSGHGKGEDWKTLLAPVDSAGGYVVPAREFQDCMAKTKIKVIIFDCCRQVRTNLYFFYLHSNYI